MAGADEGAGDLALVPQWLKHGLHSPSGAAAGPGGRQLRNSPSAAGREDWAPSAWSPKAHANGGGRGLVRGSGGGGNGGTGRGGAVAQEERGFAKLSTPYAGGAAAGAAGWRDEPRPQPGHGAAARALDDKLLWRDSSGSAGSDGGGRHHRHGGNGGPAGGGGPGAKVLLNSLDFPSLAATGATSPHSGGRPGSPGPYTPSLAPYKQGFLASRSAAGWTSKLADVPVAPAPAGELQEREAAAAAAAAGEQQQRRQQQQQQLADGAAAAAAAAAAAERQLQHADGTGRPAGGGWPAGGAAAAPGPGGAGTAGGPSLAETLRQKAAASSGPAGASHAEALHRRQNKTLVPLLPGSKAKQGGAPAGPSPLKPSEVVRPAGWRKGAAGTAAGTAAAELQSPTSGHCALLKLTLGAAASAGAGTGAAPAAPADAATGGAPAAAPGDGGSVGSPVRGARALAGSATLAGPAQAAAAAGPQPTGGVGPSGAPPEQRQQLRDRHSFFAVLRRKNSSSGGGGGQQAADDADAEAKPGEAGGVSTAEQPPGRPLSAHPISPSSSISSDRDGASLGSGAAPPPPQQQQQQQQRREPRDQQQLRTPEAPAPAPAAFDLPEEEEAFLRSLGWTAESPSDGEDWRITDEEISAFKEAEAARAKQQAAAGGGRLLAHRSAALGALRGRRGAACAAAGLLGAGRGGGLAMVGAYALPSAGDLLGLDSCGGSSSDDDSDGE